MIDLYNTLPKKNNHSASCERVAGRPTAAILDALPDLSMTRDGAFAGGLVLIPFWITSLYIEIMPQSTILPNSFMLSSAASKFFPPTFS